MLDAEELGMVGITGVVAGGTYWVWLGEEDGVKVFVVAVQEVEVQREVEQGRVVFFGGIQVEVLLVVHGVMVGLEDVFDLVQDVLVDLDEVLDLMQDVLVDLDVVFDVVQGLLEDLEVVHGMVLGFQVVFDVVHGLLEVVDGLQEVELVVFLEDVQGVLVVLDFVHLVDVEEVVQGLVEDVDEVEQDLVSVVEEHDVLVIVVEGVQVQVLQLVVTRGLPAAVVRYTWQCFEVVVAGAQCLPASQSTLGHTGPVG